MQQYESTATYNFEASPMWRCVLRDIFRLKERIIETNEGALIFWEHPLYRQKISTPFRDRVALLGNISHSGFCPQDVANLIAGDFIIKDVPYTSEKEGSKISCVYSHINTDVLLDNNIEKRLHSSARKNIRKSEKEYGLEFNVNPNASLESFYALYLSTRHRLGVPPYPKKMFQMLFDYIGGQTVLFSCNSPNGTKLGYLLCYLHGSEMISAHIAYDHNQRHQRITDFLFINAFKWGRDNQFINYRFGADNKNQESLLWSKKKLGAIPRKQYDYCRGCSEVIEDNPESNVRHLLRSLPQWAYRHSSYATYIYFK